MLNKSKICRCCLLELSSTTELYEFSSEVSIDNEGTEEPLNFVKISEAYTQIVTNLTETDEDASKICSQCLGDLKFCYLFQRKCLDNDKIYNEDEEDESKFHIVDIKPEVDADHDTIEYVEEFIEDNNDEYENDEEIIDEESYQIQDMEEQAQESMSDASASDHKENYRRSYHKTHKNTQKSSALVKTDSLRCYFCGKISATQEEHENHEQEHEGEQSYKCRKCEAKFLTKEDAREHLTKAHSNDEKSFHCTTCFKSFKNRYQLILHTRSHTGEKPFECPECNRCFSISSNLQKHMDTHSTEKPYTCEVCDQRFKTQRSLKFHTVCYHKPEAKVKCPTCDKSFVNKSYLKMHMLYHTGEKNFTCTICSSKYYKSSHLKRHIQNVHFKLRLMKCEYCASDFVRKETYKAHIISHHKRHLSDQEFDEVMEKIKKFQPPSLDINQYTLEKQKIVEVSDTNDLEMIEEDSQAEEPMGEEYFEEAEIYGDEQ